MGRAPVYGDCREKLFIAYSHSKVVLCIKSCMKKATQMLPRNAHAKRHRALCNNNRCSLLIRLMSFFRDLSLSAVVTGLVVVLVRFTSTGALVFHSTLSRGATQAQVNSWMWALGFGLEAFSSIKTDPVMVLALFAAHLLGRRFWPRYGVVGVLGVLVVGIAFACACEALKWSAVIVAWASPVWVSPEFSWSAIIGLGLPLFMVTMASQNMPAVAVMRASGFDTPVSPAITASGVSMAGIGSAFCGLVDGVLAMAVLRRRWV